MNLDPQIPAGPLAEKWDRHRFEGKLVEKPEQTFDLVLVSIGRKPNSSGLGLDKLRQLLNQVSRRIHE